MRKLVPALLSLILLAVCLFPAAAFGADREKAATASLPLMAGLKSDSPITRGQLAALVNGAFGYYTTTENPFTDLPAGHRYYYDILAAYYEGYLSGYADNTVRPDVVVSRAEAACFLDRLAPLPMPADGPVFSDSSEIPGWARQSAMRTYAAGFLPLDSETGGFAPEKPLTVGEAYGAVAALSESVMNKSRADQVLAITLSDGYELTGRLSLPRNSAADKLVIYINGSGPNTYENKRHSGDVRFRYHDVLADAFTGQGTAYFSYSTRGVSCSEQDPYYAIQEEDYATYLPSVQAKDLETMVASLKQEETLKDAKVYLLGWSEGSIVAPLALLETGLEVDGLLLCGYPNENMRDILDWQLGGGQSLFQYKNFFAAAQEDRVTQEEFEADPYGIRESLIPNIAFTDLDLNENGVIDEEDFRIMLKPQFTGLLNAVETDDSAWILENYMELTPGWFKDHFALGSTEDMLVQLDLPIYIFHGDMDLKCPVSGALDVQARFAQLGKTNLTVQIFPGHDHDLNFGVSLFVKEFSQGIQSLLDTVNTL